MTSTCLARCRGLWGVDGEDDADKNWWANLVRANVEHGFFVADNTFPADMARYVLAKIVRGSAHLGADRAKELLLSLCKAKRITKPVGTCKSSEDRLRVKRHFQTYLKAFFSNMQAALAGTSVAADSCFAAVFLENVLQTHALPPFQAPTLSQPTLRPRPRLRPESPPGQGGRIDVPSMGGDPFVASTPHLSHVTWLSAQPHTLQASDGSMTRSSSRIPAAREPSTAPTPPGQAKGAHAPPQVGSPRASSRDRRTPMTSLPPVPPPASTKVLAFTTDRSKNASQQALDIWETVVAPVLKESGTLALLYSANSQQSSVLRSNQGIQAKIDAVSGSGQARLFHEILVLIQNHKVEDRVKLLPISTSLKGGDNVSGNIVDLKHIDEELQLVSNHKQAGWHIGFIQAPRTPAKQLRVAGQKIFDIGGGISKGWDNTGRVSIYWRTNEWEQLLDAREEGGVSQGDYVELKLRGIVSPEQPPKDLNSSLREKISAANKNLPRPLRHNVCSFYYPGENAEIDNICNAPFLGNLYPCSISLQVGSMPRPVTFKNSEAAFQALKMSSSEEMHNFSNLSGQQAVDTIRTIRTSNLRFQGLKSNWTAMMEVLMAKFDQNNELKELLIQTGDTYLLEHKTSQHRQEPIWSDNCDGSGRNWLGMQLMLVRETYRAEDKRPYTKWLEKIVPQAIPAAIISNRRAPYDNAIFRDIALDTIPAWEDWHRNKKQAHGWVREELITKGAYHCEPQGVVVRPHEGVVGRHTRGRSPPRRPPDRPLNLF